jgi:hypothetical protein
MTWLLMIIVLFAGFQLNRMFVKLFSGLPLVRVFFSLVSVVILSTILLVIFLWK